MPDERTKSETTEDEVTEGMGLILTIVVLVVLALIVWKVTVG